ncbi:hypothetical protein ACWCPG_36315, partial [Streptomyces sp. NPDC001919]
MTPVEADSPSLVVLRTLLALAVVFVMLATTGWTTITHRPVPGPSREAALAAWARDRVDHRPLPAP